MVGYMAKLNRLTPPLPHPKHCGSHFHCSSDANDKPKCHTDYKPHYSDNSTTLSDLIVGQTKWEYEPGQ